MPSELQYVITDPDEYGDWYEIIDPYRRDKFQKAYELWLSDCAHGVTKEINRVDGEYGEVLIYSMPRIILDENTVECLTGNDNTGSTSGSVTLFPSKIGRVGAGEGKKLMTEAPLWDDFYLYFVYSSSSCMFDYVFQNQKDIILVHFLNLILADYHIYTLHQLAIFQRSQV